MDYDPEVLSYLNCDCDDCMSDLNVDQELDEILDQIEEEHGSVLSRLADYDAEAERW